METYKCGRCGSIYGEEEVEDIEDFVCGCGYRFRLDRWKHTSVVPLLGSRIVAVITSEYEETQTPSRVGEFYLTTIRDVDENYIFVGGWNHRTKEKALWIHERIANAFQVGRYRITLDDEVCLEPPIR